MCKLVTRLLTQKCKLFSGRYIIYLQTKRYTMCELLVSVLGTIIGGVLLTLILFLINEYGFTKPNLTGEWKAITVIDNSAYNPYLKLEIEFKIHLIQKGYDLSGSGEKIQEFKPDKTKIVFEREKRVIIEIDGYFERQYFGRSKVYLSINEVGRKRETRTTYVLTVMDVNTLTGLFTSTAADSSGKIEMNKTWLIL